MSGIVLRIIGMLINGVAIVLFFIGVQFGFIGGITFGAGAILLGILGAFCIKRGKKLEALRAEELLLEDPRAPVLYLRSFAAEALTSKGLPRTSLIRDEGIVSEEEQLAKVMNDIGPFIAIGQPGEELPTLGAARLYAENENWKETVIDKLSTAFLTLIRIGATGGLIWEVRETIKRVKPNHLLLLVPDDKSQYDDFINSSQEFFKQKLPDFPETKSLIPKIGSIRGFIYFSADGKPYYSDLKPPPFIRARHQLLVPIYKLGFKPVFEQLGITWVPPGLNWYAISVFIGFVALFLFIGIMIYIDSH